MLRSSSSGRRSIGSQRLDALEGDVRLMDKDGNYSLKLVEREGSAGSIRLADRETNGSRRSASSLAGLGLGSQFRSSIGRLTSRDSTASGVEEPSGGEGSVTSGDKERGEREVSTSGGEGLRGGEGEDKEEGGVVVSKDMRGAKFVVYDNDAISDDESIQEVAGMVTLAERSPSSSHTPLQHRVGSKKDEHDDVRGHENYNEDDNGIDVNGEAVEPASGVTASDEPDLSRSEVQGDGERSPAREGVRHSDEREVGLHDGGDEGRRDEGEGERAGEEAEEEVADGWGVKFQTVGSARSMERRAGVAEDGEEGGSRRSEHGAQGEEKNEEHMGGETRTESRRSREEGAPAMTTNEAAEVEGNEGKGGDEEEREGKGGSEEGKDGKSNIDAAAPPAGETWDISEDEDKLKQRVESLKQSMAASAGGRGGGDPAPGEGKSEQRQPPQHPPQQHLDDADDMLQSPAGGCMPGMVGFPRRGAGRRGSKTATKQRKGMQAAAQRQPHSITPGNHHGGRVIPRQVSDDDDVEFSPSASPCRPVPMPGMPIVGGKGAGANASPAGRPQSPFRRLAFGLFSKSSGSRANSPNPMSRAASDYQGSPAANGDVTPVTGAMTPSRQRG